MGGWTFVVYRIMRVAEALGFADPVPRYAGRTAAAAPATGSRKRHDDEQSRLIDEALAVDTGPGDGRSTKAAKPTARKTTNRAKAGAGKSKKGKSGSGSRRAD